MNTEVPWPEINLEVIADAYNYAPLPEGYVLPEKIDLGIDWDVVSPLVQSGLMEGAKKFREAKPEVVPTATHRSEVVLSTVNLGANGSFHVNKLSSDRVSLIYRNSSGNIVAEFWAELESQAWNLRHRLVKTEYQGQGVGKHMVRFMENFVAYYALQEKGAQSLALSVGQLDVINFFLQSGFTISDQDLERFNTILDRLKSGDDALIVASDIRDFQPGGEGNHKWYLFEREIYEQALFTDHKWRTVDLIKHGIRFSLVKNITPLPLVVNDFAARSADVIKVPWYQRFF